MSIDDLSPAELLQELDYRKAEEGYVWVNLLKGQRKVVESSADVKLVLGGNRAGKSVTGMYELNLACLGLHPARPVDRFPKWRPPVTAWLASDSHQKNRTSFVPILKRLIPRKDWNPIVGPRGEFFGNRYSNGSLMEGKSYDAKRESFQGPEIVITQLDEEPSEGIFDECIARGETCDGIVLLTMTAMRGMSWPYRRLYLPGQDPEKSKEMGVECFKLSALDSPWISDAKKRKLKALYSSDDYRIRVLGEFVHREGLVYDFVESVHVVEPFEHLPGNVNVYEVMDPGHHHWAYGFFAVYPDGKITQFDELHFAGATPTMIQEAVKVKREMWGYKEPHTEVIADSHSWAVDEKAILSTADQLERGRYPLKLRPGSKDHMAGIYRVREYMRFEKDSLGRPGIPFFRVTRNCTMTIYEFQNYMWKNTTPGLSDDRTSKKDDHQMDCIKYLVLDLPEPAFIVEPAREPKGDLSDYTLEEYRELTRRSRAMRDRPNIPDYQTPKVRRSLGF